MRSAYGFEPRLAWSCRVVNAFQVAVGEATDGDPTCLEAMTDRLGRMLTGPVSRGEALYLNQQLVLLLERLGVTLHDHFHQRFVPSRCDESDAALYRRWWPVPGVEAVQLLGRWRRAYGTWFFGAHSLPPALKAKRIIQEQYASALTLPRLAQASGASRSTLVEQFRTSFGVTPTEYRTRVRLRQALRRLRDLHVTVDDVARAVGYTTPARFRAQLRRHTDVAPGRIRQLSEEHFEQLLEAPSLSLRPGPVGQDAKPSAANWTHERRA